jgi:diketogulonate reductase-like aldo/keto reductase
MINRRKFLSGSAGVLLASQLRPAWAEAPTPIMRTIPSSGEKLPVMGMGSSRTFDVNTKKSSLHSLARVLEVFFAEQGSLIDSSPMYGQAEAVLGQLLSDISPKPHMFAATKVWTDGRESGIEQMEKSSELMGVPVFDLMQIHNLRDWKIHMKTLRGWKEEGKIRYLGVTTSHKRYHEELEQIMREEALDFVQFSYNIENRVAEERLLPMAADKGIATLINRPFQRGSLFAKSKDKALPGLATELGCDSWGQFFLKFVIGHPAVTCLIPATSRVHHMHDNMTANFGPVPDASQRAAMLKIYQAL